MSRAGEQRLTAGGVIPRHRHDAAYAAVVLQGGYHEFGDAGRWRLQEGDVVVHPAWEAHGDVVDGRDARVLNLPLGGCTHKPAVLRARAPDEVARTLRSGDPDAVAALLSETVAAPPLMEDWPDMLAGKLRRGPVHLGRWARAAGLSAAQVSRGFRAVYGVGPARYGAEVRAAAAWRALTADARPLSEVALAHGFADQPHMTRAVTALTGRPPGRWRRVKTVQDADLRRP